MNNTLQNGFTILEYLAADAEECSVKELAEHFGLPNSHVCRLLKTLADTGYVEQTPGSRKYRISLKILNLSNMRLKKLKLRNIARPYLQKLVRELERPVFLTAPYRYRSLIVATEYPERFAGGRRCRRRADSPRQPLRLRQNLRGLCAGRSARRTSCRV